MKNLFFIIVLFFLFPVLASAQETDFKEIVKKCREESSKLREQEDLELSFDCYIGATAPNFQAKTITGESIELAKLRGQVVVLYFFYHSCGDPCNGQIPALNEVVKKYRFDDVKFLALADDSEPELVEAFLREQEFEFKVIPQATDIIYETFYNPAGFPSLFVIDRKGKIQYLSSGGSAEKEQIKARKDNLITIIEKYLHN